MFTIIFFAKNMDFATTTMIAFAFSFNNGIQNIFFPKKQIKSASKTLIIFIHLVTKKIPITIKKIPNQRDKETTSAKNKYDDKTIKTILKA